MSMFWMSTRGPSPSAHLEAAEATGEARKAKSQVRDLEGRLDRALLACEALWSLVKEKLDFSDEELARRMNDLDLSDGLLDGKVRRTPMACPKCKRTISPRLPRCMFCGQPIVHDPFA